MKGLEIPESLRGSAEMSGFAHWLDGLPERVETCADRWSLRIADPYVPGGQCAWVAPAVRPDGSDCVLKVGWRHPEAEYEAEGLEAWNGNGAVHVYDSFTTDDTSVLLLERCVPGTTLRTNHTQPEQDVVVASIFERIWIAPPDGTHIPPLADLAEIWSRDVVDGPFADEARAVLPRIAERCDGPRDPRDGSARGQRPRGSACAVAARRSEAVRR